MKIILSTRNQSKALQIKKIFEGTPIIILTLDQVGVEGEAIEDGTTLAENALRKALYAHKGFDAIDSNSWTMADDTGLFINALNGKPGIKAARWAGDDATTAQITEHTLKSLHGITDRSATFETVVALVSPEGKEYFFNGKISGTLLETPRCEPQPKMPYSGLFIPDGESKVWAELTTEYENIISHRGKAFRQVREFFEKIMQ